MDINDLPTESPPLAPFLGNTVDDFGSVKDPWDERYIYLHEWLISMVHVGKYMIIYVNIPYMDLIGYAMNSPSGYVDSIDDWTSRLFHRS